jgi:large subunit ribosomal protein L15
MIARIRGSTPGVSNSCSRSNYQRKRIATAAIAKTIAKMPPRIQLLTQAIKAAPRPAYQPVAPFLYPFLQQQQRSASILSSLSDTKGAYNHVIRRGRGPSSGKGKTSGRGHKGQKQHGKVPFNFQGGQTPEIVVHGTRGEVNQ